jgi:hypothetical protein
MEKESATSMRSNPGGGGGDSGSKGEFVPRAGSKDEGQQGAGSQAQPGDESKPRRPRRERNVDTTVEDKQQQQQQQPQGRSSGDSSNTQGNYNQSSGGGGGGDTTAPATPHRRMRGGEPGMTMDPGAGGDPSAGGGAGGGGGGWMNSPDKKATAVSKLSIEEDEENNKINANPNNKDKFFQEGTDDIMVIPDLDEDGYDDDHRVAHAPRNITRKIPSLMGTSLRRCVCWCVMWYCCCRARK